MSANAAVANLIDAMLAVTQQQPVSAGVSGADAAAAQSKLAQLKSGLTPGADAGETTREAAALLSTLYPSPATSPPPAPSTPPPQAGVGAHLLPLTLTALVLALLSPLLCVLGFLRAAKAARSAIREAFTQAGLL